MKKNTKTILLLIILIIISKKCLSKRNQEGFTLKVEEEEEEEEEGEDGEIIAANSSCRPSGDNRSSGNTNKCINTAMSDKRDEEYRCNSGCVTGDYNLCCIQACCNSHSNEVIGKFATSYKNQLDSRGLDKHGNVVKQVIISDENRPRELEWDDDEEIGF
tara:strand:+ start:75 stop:554 length:480 start_codon:yes stop_codon:yes gene_type:complete